MDDALYSGGVAFQEREKCRGSSAFRGAVGDQGVFSALRTAALVGYSTGAAGYAHGLRTGMNRLLRSSVLTSERDPKSLRALRRVLS